MTGRVEQLRDHWWWRPGWQVGARYLTWHLVVDDQPEVCAAVRRYQEALRNVAVLDVVPRRWLHLTLSGVGFVTEVSVAERVAVVDAVARRLSRLPRFSVLLGGAEVGAEAVVLPVRDPGPFELLRDALRGGASDALGPDRVADRASSVRPHLSVAYVNGTAEAGRVRALLDTAELERVSPPRTRLVVHAVSLIELGRDDRRYTWSTMGRVPLGPRVERG